MAFPEHEHATFSSTSGCNQSTDALISFNNRHIQRNKTRGAASNILLCQSRMRLHFRQISNPTIEKRGESKQCVNVAKLTRHCRRLQNYPHLTWTINNRKMKLVTVHLRSKHFLIRTRFTIWGELMLMQLISSTPAVSSCCVYSPSSILREWHRQGRSFPCGKLLSGSSLNGCHRDNSVTMTVLSSKRFWGLKTEGNQLYYT